MKRLLLALLLSGCATAPEAEIPAAIQVEGVPPIPRELSEKIARYQSVRGHAFEDFGPGDSLLVLARVGSTRQLYQVRAPGSALEQLTFGEEPVAGASFVPATGGVLFTSSKGGDENYQVYRLDPGKKEPLLLTDGKSRNGLGPMNEAGDRCVLSSNRRNGRDMDLFVLEARTGALSPMLEVSGEFLTGGAWSPDGSSLLLLRYVSANESHPIILEVKTRERKPLAAPGGARASHGYPSFSSDGRGAYLTSDAEGEFKRLAYVELSTMKWRWYPEMKWDVEDVEIHGDRVAFTTNEDGASQLHLIDGGVTTKADLPLGQVHGLRFSRDGNRLGFTLVRADAPAEVYTWEIGERRLVRWTHADLNGLDPAAFTVPRRIQVPSFDGREIPAYLYRPRGSRKAPVVISIHGGPESQYRPAFWALTQYWVNELGLAVLAPNVRGSTGYGKTFTTLDNGLKREDSVKDIGALLDWIAKQPDLDASRVAVTGGSYGGYMVLASLVHFGERLRAGVDVVGIANFTTFLQRTSGYRVDLRRVEYGDERLPEMKEFFEKISPSNHAGRIRSTLLVVHGKNDPRVPFSEAELIVRKVRDGGRPVWTVYADNEGHGFARLENNIYFNAAMALFFREHLLK